MVRIVAIIFVFQVIFITTYNHLNRVSSTFKDANYTGYFLVILYAIVLIYIYIKENNVWNYIKNVLLLALGFVVIFQARFMTVNIYDINDLAHFKRCMNSLVLGCIIVLLIYLYRKWKKDKLNPNSN